MNTIEYLATLNDKELVVIINYIATLVASEFDEQGQPKSLLAYTFTDMYTEAGVALYERDDTWDNAQNVGIDL